jgi:hypothetical protein
MVAVGCEPSEYEKSLMGTWNSFSNHTPIELIFYQDSLILNGFDNTYRTNSNWSADSTKINLRNVTLKSIYTDSDTIVHKSFIYKYLLNTTKDTLTIEVLDDSSKIITHFVKKQTD